MATENISENNNLSELYENLIVIGEKITPVYFMEGRIILIFIFKLDSGCNLTNKKFTKDLDSTIQRAQDAGKV